MSKDITMQQHSANHIRECYDFYREQAPYHPGQLVKVYDGYDHKNLYAVSKVVGVYWSEKLWDWILHVEIMEEVGLCVGEFSSAQCVRHLGFMPVVVK